MYLPLHALIFITLTFQNIIINAQLGNDDDLPQFENEYSEISYATSTVSMLPLLRKQQHFLSNVNKYVYQLERKLVLIRKGLAQMREFDLAPQQSAESQLANPWRNFALMRHMSHDWFKWHELMQQRPEEKHIELKKNLKLLPNKFDVKEATMGILRIQQVFNLPIDDTVRGLFDGVQYNNSLNGFDCYQIGLVHYEAEDFIGAIKWLDIAHDYFMRHEQMTNQQELKDFYQYKVSTLWQLNRRADSLKLLSESLTLWPHDIDLKRKKSRLIQQSITMPYLEQKHNSVFNDPLDGFDCSHKFQPLTSLHCRYNNTNNDFLKLAPLKMEELSLSPYVVLFHDVLYDSEIVELKGLATPELSRARFYTGSKGAILGEVRTTHTRWLEDDASPTTVRIHQRITDMSRFVVDEAELLLIMNYGIGGHYNPHYDSFNTSLGLYERTEDRIATVLFYLSDVPQGGSTFFPYIHTHVYPKKGTAILWYNLENDGKATIGAFHAACPVIVGSKWVMSKWINENSQMFIKPCWRETQT